MLNQLRYFVAVIETGSYSRAGKQCGIGQSAVSKGVRKLEQEMEAILVDYRDGRCVPSEAGKVCYEQAKEILTRFDNMKTLIRKQDQELQGSLTLIYLTFGYLKAFRQIHSGFQKMHPGIEFDIRYDSYANAKTMLGKAEIDGFLVSAAEVNDNQHSDTVAIHHSRMIALIPKGNSLSERKELLLSDLCNEKLVIVHPEVVPVLSQAYQDYCTDAGFKPYIVDYGRKVAELAAKAALNNAIALIDDSSSYAADEGLTAVPICGSFPKLDICLIWNKRNVRREMQALVNYCRGVL